MKTYVDELKEAKDSTQEVIKKIDRALALLKRAKGYGRWDVVGGGKFVSYFKRRNIKKSRKAIKDVETAMKKLNKELKDADLFIPDGPSHTMFDNILDIFLDNVFIDISVQKEINKNIKFMKSLRKKVIRTQNQLKLKIRTEEIKKVVS